MDLRKWKKSKAREARKAADAAAPGSPAEGRPPSETASEVDVALDERTASDATTAEGREETDAGERAAERAAAVEMMYETAVERAEIAEAMYKAALARSEVAEVKEQTAAKRVAAAEAREQAAEANEKAAAERIAAAEAREKAAAERAMAAAEREQAAAERVAAVAAREQAVAAREQAAAAREQAAAERDSIANTRDRTAVERDSIANTRDRTAAGRDPNPTSRLTARDTTADDGDGALERARLEAELQRAHLDALTGAFRREMGRLALRNEIERARRADGKFVIAFIDVDGLKGVNDREGHAAGDRVLRTLAATMRANLRPYDPIVRFGGDEFILGVSSVDPSEVRHRIGVMDQSLRNATGVGITAGLATLTSNESLDELTARADAALIEAKRNRSE